MANAHAFNPDRSKAPVYTKEEADQRFYTKEEADQRFYTKEEADQRFKTITGTFSVVIVFSSVKSGSNYHAIWPLPLGNTYTAVTLEAIVSQVGVSVMDLSTSDVNVRLLSGNAIDFYMNVDAAAGKPFVASITLE